MPYRYHYDPNQPRVPQGHPDGGQWTDDERGAIQSAFFDPRREVFKKTIGAALALYTWLSLKNSRDQQAAIVFRAREYLRNDGKTDGVVLKVEDVRPLNRQEVDDACPGLNEVQELTDEAAAEVRSRGENLTPSQHGTAVHYELKTLIEDPDYLNERQLRAEVSYVKNKEENNGKIKEGKYGKKDSIRIDVLERTEDKTVCVYDIKTGRRPLSVPRMAEIAKNVFAAYGDINRIIVTEIRPSRSGRQ